MPKQEKDGSTLFERRSQLISLESFLLIAALLSQLAFMFWMGFGTRSFSEVQELFREPLRAVFLSANLACWIAIFAIRFFWQGFDQDVNNDMQTGLFNRYYFEKLLEMEIRRAGRYRYPLTLCVLDIDQFSSLNENYGKKRGDETLQGFAGFLRASVRLTDLLARHDKDEFCVLLPHTDLIRAEKFMQRVLAQSQERLDCSFSAGITTYHTGESRAQFVSRTLEALNQAKREGNGKLRCLVTGPDSQTVLSF